MTDGLKSGAAPPRIAVIVPAYQAEGCVVRAVEALLDQTLGRDAYEVVVVDDGSSDRTAEVAGAAGARVLRQANAGAAAARNHGVRETTADVLVFTDADCEPARDFLERLIAPLDDAAVDGAKGTYLTRQTEVVARLVQLEYESRYAVTRRAEARDGKIDFVETYASAFRRGVFERAGGFDDRIRMVEDQEFSFRAAAHGATMRFVPEARVHHLHASTWWRYARKKAGIGYWKVVVLRLYPERAVRDSHTPQTLKLEVALAGLFWAALVAAAPFAGWTGLRWAWLAPLAPLAALLALAAPFVARAARRGAVLAAWAPLFVLVRDTALGLGFFWGALRAPRLTPHAVQSPEEGER